MSDRRYMQKLILVYKYKNGVLPDYLNDLFPVTVNEANPYNLRNNMDFVTLARRTEIHAKSVIPSSLKLWNELDENTRASDTLLSFKSKLKAKFKPPVVPQYYLLGNRCEQIHHARLRNKCSNLSGDLHRNHISDSPRCDCGHNYEDADHYFFNCQRFANQRLQLFLDTRLYHPLSIQKLLYGIVSLTDEENALLFAEVHHYIKSTQRF